MKTIQDLPSPKGSLITGHLTKFKSSDKHLVMEEWVNEVGTLFKISLAGKKLIVSADENINRQILKQRPEKFRRYYKINEVLEEMGILGVFNAEGETWKRHRKITSEALNLKNVISYFPAIKEVTIRLINKWKKNAATNSRIEVQEEMMRFTVDITSSVAFGYPMNTLEKEGDVIQQDMEKIFPMINWRVIAPIPFWRIIKSKKDKELDNAIKRINETINQCISEARKRLQSNPKLKEKPSNFLEALLVEQEKDGSFSDKEIFGNVFTMLLAGEDTTSNSISWAIYYLMQHPEAVKKIRQEAFEFYGNEIVPPDTNILQKLKYAEAVAMESMRLKPVTPVLYMEALEDVTIHDLLIKKGEMVALQNKVAQTSENNFAYADTFKPERWLRSSGCPVTGAHNPDAIRVFGGGARFCPGKNLALYEMITAISSICKNFDIEPAVEIKEIKEIFSFTMYPENLSVRIKAIH